MNVSRVAVLLFTVAVVASHADETNLNLTVNGMTYSNVTFGTVTRSSVSFRHSTGAASILLEKLPPELQKRFGYDPQKVAAMLLDEQQKRNYQQQKSSYNAHPRVLLEGTVLEEQQVMQMSGRVMASPVSVRDADGRTYRGSFLEGRKVSGHDIRYFPGGSDGNPQGSHAASVPQITTVNFFVRDYFPTNSIGRQVTFVGKQTSPVGGYETWVVGEYLSFDEWQALQKQR